MTPQYSRVSGAFVYFLFGMKPVSSNNGKYIYDSMSQDAPGYLFQYQVPPKSPPFSIILKSSKPASLSLAAASMPPKPPPIITISE